MKAPWPSCLLAGVALATIVSLVPAHAAAPMKPRPITVHDLVRLERISDPQLSPDGARLAYTQRSTDYEANKGVTQICLLDITSGQRRVLTTSGSNSSPRWSGDGTQLYFSSTRSGSAQIWRLDLGGGEAQAVSALPLDVGSFKLSPDGRRIAFSLEVFPDCAGDLACSKKMLAAQAAQKNTGKVFDRLFIRHWDSWFTGTRSQLFSAAVNDDGTLGTPVLLSRDIDGDVPSKPFGDDSEYAFSPDGRTVVFTARIAGRTEAWSTNLDRWQVPADGSGKPRNLTAAKSATDTGPVFSPDGR